MSSRTENNESNDFLELPIEEETSCFRFFPQRLCHPSFALHRYFVLFFMCMLGFGSYYCYDNPGALQNQIIDDLKISLSTFSQLYAWYSWPNTILCFFGGFLIDRVFGIRLGAVIFAGCIFLGQLVFAGGAFINSYYVMILGRFIFGIGGESLAVAQNTYAVSWFKDKELNMVFGLQLSISRAGSTANFLTMVLVYNQFHEWFSGYVNLGVTLLFASATCLLSFICALILAYFDKRATKLLKKDDAQTGEKVNLTDAKNFSLSFWLICVICVTYYVSIFPFTAIASTFFQRKYDMSQKEANSVDGIIYIISAFISPVLGILVDYTGRNIFWVLVAILITQISHALLAFTFIHPLVAMITMGFGYSVLACALWPMVSLVIPTHQLGTAYGIMQSVQNLGLGCVVLSAGYIVDYNGNIVLEIFFLAWISLCLIASIMLYMNDQRTGGFLNMSIRQRKLLKNQETSMKIDYTESNSDFSGPSTE